MSNTNFIFELNPKTLKLGKLCKDKELLNDRRIKYYWSKGTLGM